MSAHPTSQPHRHGTPLPARATAPARGQLAATPKSARFSFALALALALALGGCGTPVRNPVTGETERTVMDERTEIAEGAKGHQEVLKAYTALADPALQAYVDRIGQKIAAQSHRSSLKWTFTVLDSPEINAFALPGGYVYVTRGIMAHLDSEADLAGVIGHEIGHVTARHGAQRATAQQRASIFVLGATVLGGLLAGDSGAQVASQATQQYQAGSIARYGREQELQADQLGAEYLSRVRYDPKNMIDVIQALKDQERYAADAARAAGRAVPQGGGWLASHPSNDQRLQAIRSTALKLAGSRAAADPAGGRAAADAPGGHAVAAWDDDGRERYLKAIDGMPFGDGREQGVVRGRNFFHEPLGIALTAPAGWRIVNDTEQLVVMSGAGDAVLVMKMIPEEMVKKIGTDHAALLRDALGATTGTTEKLTLGGGLAATHFSGQRRNAQGQTGPLTATIVSGPGGRMFLLGWSARDAQAMQKSRAVLREAELSFRPLTAADRSAARPWRVKLAPFPAGGFAQLARSTPLTELPEQQLLLLNSAYHEGTAGGAASRDPKPGQLVKVIE
ncbi:MAG: M48 family metalloprotease [Burkholderiales bacterium]|nr:M48 family metalloprotease [Burkholderiales bacterium]